MELLNSYEKFFYLFIYDSVWFFVWTTKIIVVVSILICLHFVLDLY